MSRWIFRSAEAQVDAVPQTELKLEPHLESEPEAKAQCECEPAPRMNSKPEAQLDNQVEPNKSTEAKADPLDQAQNDSVEEPDQQRGAEAELDQLEPEKKADLGLQPELNTKEAEPDQEARAEQEKPVESEPKSAETYLQPEPETKLEPLFLSELVPEPAAKPELNNQERRSTEKESVAKPEKREGIGGRAEKKRRNR